WQKSRNALMPNLPIEVLRGRVKRAKEIGLDYKSYASIRAASGHDVIAFLFSSNALRAFVKSPQIPDDRLQQLNNVQDCARLAATLQPLSPEAFMAALPNDPAPLFNQIFAAPNFTSTWSQTRETLLTGLRADKLPRNGVVVIGDTTQERAWSEAARLAGYLSADRFFTSATQP
ncbi:MAG: hypothetical protein JKY31_03605, partial [Rhodobacteraceae bacterium]|nr:hypothetical protein [Paracoccaceae bacterium]